MQEPRVMIVRDGGTWPYQAMPHLKSHLFSPIFAITQQQKFRRNLEDWNKGDIFDLIAVRGRSRSKHRRYAPNRGGPSLSDSEEEGQKKVF